MISKPDSTFNEAANKHLLLLRLVEQTVNNGIVEK